MHISLSLYIYIYMYTHVHTASGRGWAGGFLRFLPGVPGVGEPFVARKEAGLATQRRTETWRKGWLILSIIIININSINISCNMDISIINIINIINMIFIIMFIISISISSAGAMSRCRTPFLRRGALG